MPSLSFALVAIAIALPLSAHAQCLAGEPVPECLLRTLGAPDAASPGSSAVSSNSTPTAAPMLNAATRATLVQSLQNELAQLQATIARLIAERAQQSLTVSPADGSLATTTPGTSLITLYRNLSRGSRGIDVRQLQLLLIDQKLLASDAATGFFGPLTEMAVQRWQTQNSIVSSGTAATTGFGAVGPRTRASFNSRFKLTQTVTPTSGETFVQGTEVHPTDSPTTSSVTSTPLPVNLMCPVDTRSCPNGVRLTRQGSACTFPLCPPETIFDTESVISTDTNPIVTTPTPTAPGCSITASPTSIAQGTSATLTWSAKDATAAAISPSIGSVSVNSSQSVTPTQTTTYTMTVTGAGGQSNCSTAVVVSIPETFRSGTYSNFYGSSFTAAPYCSPAHASGNDGQSAGLVRDAEHESFSTINGSNVTSCIDADFATNDQRSVRVEYWMPNSICSDTCVSPYCSTDPGGVVFTSTDKVTWETLGSLPYSTSENDVEFNANAPFRYARVCRGGGGHSRSNLAVDYLAAKRATSQIVTGLSCAQDGVTVTDGASRIFYSARTVPAGENCAAYNLNRQCNTGVLDGSSSYQYASCTTATTVTPTPPTTTSCERVRHYRYSLSAAKALTCDSTNRTALFNIEIPDRGNAIAKLTAQFRNNSSDIYFWNSGVRVGAVKAGYNVGDDICPSGTRQAVVLGFGELTNSNHTVVVNSHQGAMACSNGVVSALSGAYLDVWVEDANPACKGKDIFFKSALQDLNLLYKPTNNLQQGAADRHGAFIWTTTLRKMLGITLPANDTRGSLILTSVEGSVDNNSPNRTCSPLETSLKLTSRILFNGTNLDTVTQPLPPSQGMGHGVLSNQVQNSSAPSTQSTVELQVAVNMSGNFSVFTAGSSGDASFAVIRLPLIEKGSLTATTLPFAPDVVSHRIASLEGVMRDVLGAFQALYRFLIG